MAGLEDIGEGYRSPRVAPIGPTTIPGAGAVPTGRRETAKRGAPGAQGGRPAPVTNVLGEGADARLIVRYSR